MVQLSNIRLELGRIIFPQESGFTSKPVQTTRGQHNLTIQAINSGVPDDSQWLAAGGEAGTIPNPTHNQVAGGQEVEVADAEARPLVYFVRGSHVGHHVVL